MSRGTSHVVVDGANVVGSRPDGWWRDRPAAARRLAGQLIVALTEAPDRLADAVGAGPGAHVHLVLEGRAAHTPDLPAHPALSIVHAQADGDSAIVALTGELGGDDVVVVTADRGLRARVLDIGAATAGPAILLDALSPVDEPASTDRSVTLLDDSDEAYFSTGEEWDAER